MEVHGTHTPNLSGLNPYSACAISVELFMFNSVENVPQAKHYDETGEASNIVVNPVH